MIEMLHKHIIPSTVACEKLIALHADTESVRAQE